MDSRLRLGARRKGTVQSVVTYVSPESSVHAGSQHSPSLASETKEGGGPKARNTAE